MSEEYDSEIEEEIWQAAEELKVAMMTGDYKKANSLLDFLTGTKKGAEMAKENKKNKSVEDIMVA